MEDKTGSHEKLVFTDLFSAPWLICPQSLNKSSFIVKTYFVFSTLTSLLSSTSQRQVQRFRYLLVSSTHLFFHTSSFLFFIISIHYRYAKFDGSLKIVCRDSILHEQLCHGLATHGGLIWWEQVVKVYDNLAYSKVHFFYLSFLYFYSGLGHLDGGTWSMLLGSHSRSIILILNPRNGGCGHQLMIQDVQQSYIILS